MCEGCGKAVVHQFAERRAFLKLILTAPAGFACNSYAVAQVNKVAPKPGNVLTPDAALDRLMKGNARYVEEAATRCSTEGYNKTRHFPGGVILEESKGQRRTHAASSGGQGAFLIEQLRFRFSGL
jgi:hypothetical protein